MTISGQFLTNGKNNGGVFAPNGSDFALLGDLAVETATEDYFCSAGDDLNHQGSDDVPDTFVSSADGLEIRKASVPVTALSHRALRLKVTLTE